MASKSVYTQSSDLTTVTKFAADVSGQTWADLTNAGSLTTRYVLGEGADARLARVDADGVSWLLTDRLGAVRNVTNGSGILTATTTYDGYGNVTASSGTLGEYGFKGQRSFAEVGLLKGDLSARWYNPATGTWMEEDSIRWSGGDTNLKRYVGNNPVNLIDPTGSLNVPLWKNQNLFGTVTYTVITFEGRALDGRRFNAGGEAGELHSFTFIEAKQVSYQQPPFAGGRKIPYGMFAHIRFSTTGKGYSWIKILQLARRISYPEDDITADPKAEDFPKGDPRNTYMTSNGWHIDRLSQASDPWYTYHGPKDKPGRMAPEGEWDSSGAELCDAPGNFDPGFGWEYFDIAIGQKPGAKPKILASLQWGFYYKKNGAFVLHPLPDISGPEYRPWGLNEAIGAWNNVAKIQLPPIDNVTPVLLPRE